MCYFLTLALVLVFAGTSHCFGDDLTCQEECTISSNDELSCAFDVRNRTYRLFPSLCALERFKKCSDADIVQTGLIYCIKDQFATRRTDGESCPVFCPSHYRPVCGANKYRSYAYRTFNNACYLDMLNCRGDEDFDGYTQVPLEFCQNHLMKNIYKEVVVMSNVKDYHDYN